MYTNGGLKLVKDSTVEAEHFDTLCGADRQGRSRTDTPQTDSYVEEILEESGYAFLQYYDAILNAGSPRLLVEQFQRFVDRFV